MKNKKPPSPELAILPAGRFNAFGHAGRRIEELVYAVYGLSRRRLRLWRAGIIEH